MLFILCELKTYWLFSSTCPQIFHFGFIILVSKINLFPYSIIFIEGLPKCTKF